MGIIIGALFLVGGVVTLLLGVSGSIEWVLKGGGIESKLSNAAPGVFIALLGAIVLWRYKPVVKKHLNVNGDSSSFELYQGEEERDDSC
ncbi:MAG TPA: hypothetical protein VGQ46_16045 [Thermoanaerobaculia bacterium]|jgi:hypothetical protein|nr:hypothetical protein [Thermoanaerobaculia bacterium]